MFHASSASVERSGTPVAGTGDERAGGARSHAFANRLMPVMPVMPVMPRTPILHRRLSRELMLITFTGRSSGRRFTTPQTYAPTRDGVLFFSNNRWWRNLRGGAPVTLRLGGRIVDGMTTPVEDAETVVREVRAYLERRGVAKAGRIGLALEASGVPSAAAVAAASREHVVVYVATGQA